MTKIKLCCKLGDQLTNRVFILNSFWSCVLGTSLLRHIEDTYSTRLYLRAALSFGTLTLSVTMAASAKILDAEKPVPTEDWTIVMPRRGKKTRNFNKILIPDQQREEKPWTPIDFETDPVRESKLMQKMQICIQKLENSEFFHSFLHQMQNPDMLAMFLNVLGPETKMVMVMYGIGSIESFEPPRLQLSLAVLMKRNFDWVGEIEVFDPIISLTECKVLTSLGCRVLSINEQGRREALKPTLFFMPHCEADLYDNLLQVNWGVDKLNRIVLFGNSFEAYEHHVSVFNNSDLVDSRKHILAVRRFTKEFIVSAFSDDFFRAFHGSSWHFFGLNPETDLQTLDDKNYIIA